MREKKEGMVFFLVMTALLLGIPTPAHAYIDPGTGSLLLQGLAAALITGLAFVRGIREKIMSIFKRKDK